MLPLRLWWFPRHSKASFKVSITTAISSFPRPDAASDLLKDVFTMMFCVFKGLQGLAGPFNSFFTIFSLCNCCKSSEDVTDFGVSSTTILIISILHLCVNKIAIIKKIIDPQCITISSVRVALSIVSAYFILVCLVTSKSLLNMP